MLRSSLRVSAIVFFLPAIAWGQYNPNGWIQGHGWNMLLPLTQGTSCGAGGSVGLSLDWLCPHRIDEEDPKAGDEWPDLDLGGCSPALGLPTGGLFDVPTWISGDFILDRFALDLGSNDLVDFRSIIGALNGSLDPQPRLSSDDALAVATTYVRNLTGAPLAAELCTSSDDSSQVWLNDGKVIEVSACRAASSDCNERTPIFLPPGISRISVLVWQGAGGWEMRVGLLHEGSLLMDGNGQVEFLGTGEGDPTIRGQRLYRLRRSTPTAGSCGVPQADMTLTGVRPPGFAGSDSDPLSIVEHIESGAPASLQITEVSHAGQISNRTSPGLTSQGFLQEWLLLGPFSRPGGPAPGEVAIRSDYLTDGAGIIESTIAPRAGDTVSPDFGGSAASTGLAFSSPGINPGGIPTWTAHHSPDQVINFDRYYASLNDVMVYALTYIHLDEATPLSLGLSSDDSIQVLVDGVEVHLANVARGFIPSDPLHEVVPLGTLSAGMHRVMVKVFEGEGGHAFRLRFQDPITGLPFMNGLGVCLDPGQSPCATASLIGKTITWNVTRAQADGGLGYRVLQGGQTQIRFSGGLTNGAGTTGLGAVAVKPLPQGPAGIFEKAQDVGFPRYLGSTSYQSSTGNYTVNGSGADIWDNGDSFHFAYREVTGDFRATARITEISGPPVGRWGKNGLMARYTCDPTSKYSFAMVPYRGEDPQLGDVRRHQSRRDHLIPSQCRDGQTPPAGSLSHPYLGWLRLTRVGGYFFSEFADDAGGQPGAWVFAGGDTHPAPPETLMVGLAVCAHETSGEGPLIVEFDHVSIDPFSFDEPPCFGEGAPLLSHDFRSGMPVSAVVADASGPFGPREDDGRLRLTEETFPGTATAVYFSTDGLLLGDQGFLAEFSVFCRNEQGPPDPPADGVTFAVFQGTIESAATTLGRASAELGYQAQGPDQLPYLRKKSFAVEIDTGDNGHPFSDPPGAGTAGGQERGYHVGLDFNQSVQSAQTNVEFGEVLPPYFNQPDGIRLEVLYTPVLPEESLIQVWARPGSGNAPKTLVLSALGPRLEGDLFLGFTASTGGVRSTQEVDDLVVRALTPPAPGDCNANGTPDYCEVGSGAAADCNGNAIPDSCDVATGTALDCNENSVPDFCDIASGSSTDVNGDLVPDDCQTDVRVVAVPVTVDPAGTPDSRTSLPAPAQAVVRGSTFWVEVWASDVGTLNTGLTGVYIDASFCTALTPRTPFHGSRFTQFPSGTINQGVIDEFGGSKLPSGGGAAPEWVRVGWVEVGATNDAAACGIQLLPSQTGVAAFTRGLIQPAFVSLEPAELAVLSSSTDYDLDDDGRIGLGDLSLFAGSWLQSIPPASASHDFDCDNFVGVGDLSWFATGWLKEVDDPAISFPPCGAGGGGAMKAGGGALDVEFRLAALATPSPSDLASSPPGSLSQVAVGAELVIEVWASDLGDVNTGFTSAYLDLAFPAEDMQVLAASPSAAFDVFPSGSMAPGLVDELGGSALPGGKGAHPSWVRVASARVRAKRESPSAVLALSRSASGVACLGRGVIPWTSIGLDELSLALGDAPLESFRRGDANSDRGQDLSDAVFILGWLFVGGPEPSCLDAADANDSGEIDLSDAIALLGWLFTGGFEPPDPGPRTCGPDPTPDPLPPCDYPSALCGG